MSKKDNKEKSATSKKSKKSKKSTKSSEQQKKLTKFVKSADKSVGSNRPRSPCLPSPKTATQMPAPTNKSIKKSIKSRKSQKKPPGKPPVMSTIEEKSKSSKSSKSSKKALSNMSVNLGLSPASGLSSQLETLRKRLQQLDVEYRNKVEEETKHFERLEAEQMEKLNEQNLALLEKQIKQIQDDFQTKIEECRQEMDRKQQEHIQQMLASENRSTSTSENKRLELEKEIATKQNEVQLDIERYSQRRSAEMEEQISRIRAQCEADIAEYTSRRRQTAEQLLEQIKQKLDLEIQNDEQKSKLSMTLRVDKVKERFAKTQSDEVDRLNQEMTQAIAELRANNEEDLGQRRVESKKALHKDLEGVRKNLDDEYQGERARVAAAIEELEFAIKGNLKQEHRDFERRKKTKQELLALLSMDDMWRLSDEELITRRHHFTIERSTIIQQSAASTIYEANKEGSGFLCKITMLDKWSIRHRADFAKHSTRLARYLTENHEKAPYFVKVVEILSTDSKVYTFMEPLESTKTLQMFFDSLGGARKKKSASNKTKSVSNYGPLHSNLKKNELVNVLSQVVNGCYFLNNMFVSHGNLDASNVTLQRTGDLTSCQVVLTGLTRPLVYYSVESDMIIPVKGFEIPPTEDTIDFAIDHLPAECFEAEFVPSQLDTYSIGILAYQLLRLFTPFAKLAALPKKVLNLKQTTSVKLTLDNRSEGEHSQMPSLISELTQSTQRRRLALDDILEHAYFKQ